MADDVRKVAALIVGAILVMGGIAGCGNSVSEGHSTISSYVSSTPRSVVSTPRTTSNTSSIGRASLLKLERCSTEGVSYIQDWNRSAQDFVDAYLEWQVDYSSDADAVFFRSTIDVPGRLNSVVTKLTRLKNSSDCNEVRNALERMIAERKIKVNGINDIRTGIRNQNWALAEQGFDAMQRAGAEEISIICNRWIPILEQYSYAFDDTSRATYLALNSFC